MEQYQKSINLNSVALCFQGFIKDEHNIMRPITAPIYSNPVNNLSKFNKFITIKVFFPKKIYQNSQFTFVP